jgi:hypothetical protein
VAVCYRIERAGIDSDGRLHFVFVERHRMQLFYLTRDSRDRQRCRGGKSTAQAA